jgi:hypothetical protein
MQSRAKKVISTPSSTTTITSSFSMKDNLSPDAIPTSSTEESVVVRSDIGVEKGSVNFTTTRTNKISYTTATTIIEGEEVKETRLTCKL